MLACEICSELFPQQEAGAVALASRAQAMSRNVDLSRRQKKEQNARYFVQLACRAIECIRHQPNSVPDVVQNHTHELCRVMGVRVTAKEFNDAKKYGPRAELYFLLLRNMCREPEHVSRNRPPCPFFLHSAGKRASLR